MGWDAMCCRGVSRSKKGLELLEWEGSMHHAGGGGMVD